MPLDDVRIRLDAFEGPLDLLLYLIRRDELDVTDIPIAAVTEQYLASLRSGGVERLDVEQAGEFLVMAATLMEIKSRLLMPAGSAGATLDEPGARSGEADPRAELVAQLLAYKRYRDAAAALEQRQAAWAGRFPAGGAAAGALEAEPAGAEAEPAAVLEDLTIVDLAAAFARILETVDLARVGEHHVRDDETPIQLHAEDIVDRLRREHAFEPVGTSTGAEPGGASSAAAGVDFRALVSGRTRAEAVGLFLALLELVRQQRVRVRLWTSGGGGASHAGERVLLWLAAGPDEAAT